MGVFSGLNFGGFKRLFSTQAKKETGGGDSRKTFQHQLQRRWLPRIEMELKNWKATIMMAEDPMRPRREPLYQLYKTVLDDEHLIAQIRTAKFTVKLGDYIIEAKGKASDELKKLFQTPWFSDYLDIEVDTELNGHSLIEFNPEMKEGRFQNIYLVPREHVRPETGEILINAWDETGIPYRDNAAINKYLVETGRPEDLGLLKTISKIAIKKDYAQQDWDRRNEKYGMPFLVVKTASRQKDELDKKEDMAANFGSNGWAILDDQDEVELLESTAAFTYQTFKDRIAYCDDKISMLVNGQTGTSDEKAYVGSAEVHERILNDYTLARMSRIQSDINHVLLPFLTRHGYPLDGAEFKFTDLLEEKNKDKKTSLESPADPNPGGQKKKGANERIRYTLAAATGCGCGDEHINLLTQALDLDGIMDEVIQRIWKEKLQAGDLDADTWRYNTEQLWKAAQSGAGKNLIETAYADPDYELLTQFRQNIFVFSAFKNHNQISDMVAALLKPDGTPRSWQEFKEVAQQINGQYFENWLRAEYDTAHGSARIAAKWNDFASRKDVLPYLRYVTQRDERVREAHRVLEGVTLRMDDPFWQEFTPPNGWKCRCDIIQTAGPEMKPTLLPSDEQVHPMWRFNPATSGELFPQSHPYFSTVPAHQRPRLIKAASRIIYNNYDSNFKKLYFDEGTGGYVVKHKDHTAHELKQNIVTARRLAQAGEAIELLDDKIEGKSPDALVNGLLWEFKNTSGSASSVQNLLRKGKKQASRIVLTLPKKFVLGDIIRGMLNAVNLDTKEDIKTVLLIFPDGNLVELGRKDIVKRNFEALKRYLD